MAVVYAQDPSIGKPAGHSGLLQLLRKQHVPVIIIFISRFLVEQRKLFMGKFLEIYKLH